MKNRAIHLGMVILAATVTLFIGLTGGAVAGINPGLRWLVFGAAFFALTVGGLFLLSRRRALPRLNVSDRQYRDVVLLPESAGGIGNLVGGQPTQGR